MAETKRGLPGVKLGSSWGQAGVKLGSSWGQAGIKLGASWGHAGVKLGSNQGQPGGVNLDRPTLMMSSNAPVIVGGEMGVYGLIASPPRATQIMLATSEAAIQLNKRGFTVHEDDVAAPNCLADIAPTS